MTEAIYLTIGILIGAVGVYWLTRGRGMDKSMIEQIISVANEKLGASKDEIRSDSHARGESLKQLIEEIRRQLTKTDEQLRQSNEGRIADSSSLRKELESHQQQTKELRGSTEDLKRVLSNNQLRGQFGEQVAEELLKMAGFVIGQNYLLQAQSGVGRPDITLLMPDGTKVQIDAKFPYANLQRFTEATDDEERQKYIKLFTNDVREKIRQVATRDYINPEEQTVDFAVAFIPNEMIFSFIYDRMNDVWEEGMRKKVVLAGPFSFTAMLRLIHQAHSNFKFQKDTHRIIGLIQRFRQEYDKFSGELDLLGNRLESAAKQFQTVSTTRSRQLGRVIDQIDAHSQDDKPRLDQ